MANPNPSKPAPTAEHAQLTAAGCDEATAAKVAGLLPQSGLTLTQILDLARRVPWGQVIALMTALASGNPANIVAAVLAIITAIQSSAAPGLAPAKP